MSYRKQNPKTDPKRLERVRRYMAIKRKSPKFRKYMVEYSKRYRIKNKKTLAIKQKQYQQTNALYINLRRKSLTLDDYNKVIKNQGLTCAICNGPPGGRWKKYNIDHCHKTGKLRGLLCKDCNQGLGLFKDNHEFLTRAAKYLKRQGR